MKITKKDFYLLYPYKCAYKNNTIPRPYFSKTEVDCNNKHSLEYNEWAEIVDVLLEELQQYILEGNKYELPEMLGFLEIVKHVYKNPRYGFITENGEVKRIIFKSTRTSNYSPLLKWRRPRLTCKMPNPWIWRIRLMPIFKKKLSDVFVKNPLKFNDAV